MKKKNGIESNKVVYKFEENKWEVNINKISVKFLKGLSDLLNERLFESFIG